MPLKSVHTLTAAAFITLLGETTAIAQTRQPFNTSSFVSGEITTATTSSQSGALGDYGSILNGEGSQFPWGNSGSIPTDVWDVMQSQTGIPEGYGDIFSEGNIPETVSQEIWKIAQPQLGIPDAYADVFSGSASPGSIPQNVWDVMQSQAGLSSEYGDVMGGIGDILSGESQPFLNAGNGVIIDDWGASFVPGSINGAANQIPQPSVTRLPQIPNVLGQAEQEAGMGQVIKSGEERIPDIGEVIPNIREAIPNIGEAIGNIRLPSLPNINPFRRAMEWARNAPLAGTFGNLGKSIRGVFDKATWGFFTQNPVIKARDQANLIDQELARMIAEPRLGEAGQQWLAGEAQETMTTMSSGLQSANAAIQLSEEAQSLTSTQDVAKAVAQQGGQNAAISASLLQMQGQNQASLLQLQQLTSSSIQLAADNSEGIDEANRRDRVERTTALNNSAREFIYVPGVFDSRESKP
jgi:hypothetical protein